MTEQTPSWWDDINWIAVLTLIGGLAILATAYEASKQPNGGGGAAFIGVFGGFLIFISLMMLWPSSNK